MAYRAIVQRVGRRKFCQRNREFWLDVQKIGIINEERRGFRRTGERGTVINQVSLGRLRQSGVHCLLDTAGSRSSLFIEINIDQLH